MGAAIAVVAVVVVVVVVVVVAVPGLQLSVAELWSDAPVLLIIVLRVYTIEYVNQLNIGLCSIFYTKRLKTIMIKNSAPWSTVVIFNYTDLKWDQIDFAEREKYKDNKVRYWPSNTASIDIR